jgi:hypothetical protein
MWKKKKAADRTRSSHPPKEQAPTSTEAVERDPAVRRPTSYEDLAWGDEGIDDPPTQASRASAVRG